MLVRYCRTPKNISMRRFALFVTASVLLCVLAPRGGLAGDPVPKSVTEAREQFEQADAELNKVYQQCYVGEIVQSQAELQEAQRLWIKCRDLTAAAYQRGETGRQRHDDNYYFYARTILTRSRIKELKELFFPK